MRRDGSSFWVSENVIVIRYDSGVPVHAIVTVDDITERKAAGRKIQQLNLDLSHSARVNAMGQMATGLTHELNQPLLAISQNMDTALYLLREQSGNEGELEILLQESDRQAHRAGDIIKALRGFVKKEGVEKEAFDFAELLEQTLHLLRSEAKEHGISIKTTAENLEPVYGSRVQIAQVLVNLLRNAIDALACIDTNERLVKLSAKNVDTGILVSVTDTGLGFAQDVDLFEQFHTTKKDGMGLGLSICRTIVEAHRGKIWHQRDENGNSQFCFSLPALGPGMTADESDELDA